MPLVHWKQPSDSAAARDVAMEALSAYLEWRIPRIEDLNAALHVVEHGEFASDDEVAAVAAKYAKPRLSRVPSKPLARRRVK